MPLTVGQYWLSGMGSDFSTGMILFGGLIAGYLAERNSTGAVHAGIGAGVVGGVPGYVWILPALVEFGTSFATAWSSPVAGAILMGFAGVVVIGIAALPGFLGGIVGAWLARNVERRRAVPGSA
ncbi:DUF5518 domain-containing protein [Halorarum halophilum]|uniref:DUF5518 domain-containing protein n=2 Tax=Halorarum halophilum TaxID=2743090 RepID=A0A7D5GEM0_9EURY|nr:DUF5518 domain-containing protein [Halobaculum halophilum]